MAVYNAKGEKGTNLFIGQRFVGNSIQLSHSIFHQEFYRKREFTAEEREAEEMNFLA